MRRVSLINIDRKTHRGGGDSSFCTARRTMLLPPENHPETWRAGSICLTMTVRQVSAWFSGGTAGSMDPGQGEDLELVRDGVTDSLVSLKLLFWSCKRFVAGSLDANRGRWRSMPVPTGTERQHRSDRPTSQEFVTGVRAASKVKLRS